MDLFTQSIRVIKEGQDKSGAYIACPSFPSYQYCWLRDGSFIAFAMDTAGEYDSAAAFFQWVHRTIIANKAIFERLLKEYDRGEDPEYLAPARYCLDGSRDTGDWPNYQLDGYGTWLWALSEHIRLTGGRNLIDTYEESVSLTVEYLKRYWNHQNYDCWEENGDKIHTSTLGCIYGGLNAVNQYLIEPDLANLIDTIRQFISDACVQSGRLIKYLNSDQVDANLLWLCVPFEVFDANSLVMRKTVEKIKEKLLHRGGVHRYARDTYYGGGEWLLLSSWLGWYYAAKGDVITARILLNWVENQADEEGFMPEQTLDHVNDPAKIREWVDRWGDVAKPLLWSHAMYIVLVNSLQTGG